jgi:hypothetical protein
MCTNRVQSATVVLGSSRWKRTFPWAINNREGWYRTQLLNVFAPLKGLCQLGEVNGGELIMQGPFCRRQPKPSRAEDWVWKDPPKMGFQLFLDALPILAVDKLKMGLENALFLHIKDEIRLLPTLVDGTVDGGTDIVFLRLDVAMFSTYIGQDEFSKFGWEGRKVVLSGLVCCMTLATVVVLSL